MLYDRAPVPDSYYPPAGVEPKAYTDEIVKGHLGRVFKNEIFISPSVLILCTMNKLCFDGDRG
jgi:hypothetical protein